MRIVFLDRGTIGPSVALAKPAFPHEWIEHENTPESEVVKRLAKAQIAITNKVPIRRQHLDKLPDLKVIAVAATGCDVIDLEACQQRGIPVKNVVGYAASTVFTVAWMVIVTAPLPGIPPFQVTVLVATVATAVPLVAVADTRVSCEGSTSVNSSPGLSSCALAAPLVSRTV